MDTIKKKPSKTSKVTARKNRAQRRLVKELFPSLFSGNYPLPMKAGIKDDMLTQIVRRGLDISEEKLQQSLRACCCSQMYQLRILNMRYRRDIDGKPVEEITQADKKHARKRIEKYRNENGLMPLTDTRRKKNGSPHKTAKSGYQINQCKTSV